MEQDGEAYDKLRIAIGVPSHDTWQSETALCVAALAGYMAEKYVATGQMEIRFVTISGTILSDMRNAMVEKAMQLECTHLLWIDSDMKFPASGLEQLLAHNKPVVGTNYSRRRRPCRPTAATWPTDGKQAELIYEEGQTGLQEVQYMGMGFCLTELAVFEALPKPWFHFGWNEQAQRCIGEDVYFLRMLREIDCPAYIDHDLSARIEHIGTHDYTHADALADREEVLRRQNGDNNLQRATDGDGELVGSNRPDKPDP